MPRQPRKPRHDDFRVAADKIVPGEPGDATGTGFDELVVGVGAGCWLHCERLDNRVWWLRIGEAHITVRLDGAGGVKGITLCDWGKQVKQ